MTKNKNVLISGASIAGPALAHWLPRYGFDVTVVERAPELRPGGHNVDFRGDVHLNVLERMGILTDVRQMQTHGGKLVVVDGAGRQLAALPSEFMSGAVEIGRGDLATILYDRTKHQAEYVFGDYLTSLTETAGGVDVTFDRGAPRTFDLVVGADGMHSGVRALTFGPESRFTKFLGYYTAGASGPNHLDLDHTSLLYNEPGLGVMIGSNRDRDEAGPGFVFASEQLDYDRHDVEQQKKIVADRFQGVGWLTPRLLEDMWASPDFYFDSISQIHLDRFSKGRVALLGDAGYGATMGGMGTGLAVVCAYVLAGELATAAGDHRVAFAAYERRIRDYAKGCQKISGNAGPFLAPPTEAKIRRRNRAYRLLSAKPLQSFFNRLTTKAATNLTLPDYLTAK
ncbi:FAD-dependent monooxygenase [Amycolatopsis nigrescens]|uniref:FAD-dependent monooxygenase n=1 Tax=Amycolatopsis nigrescens TaxID=381445 RepID=UPI00037B9245|nr:FAD-dependent monooxygenase [Amycolatopsis nigrescens]